MNNKVLKNFFVTLLVIFQAVNLCYAVEGDEDIDALVEDTKSDLLVVVGGGLAGAILGLSTLSFVEEPKEHTKNIIMGASLGIIMGVGYVAFSQATKSSQMLGPGDEGEAEEVVRAKSMMDTSDRSRWHLAALEENQISFDHLDKINLNFRF